MLAIGIRYLNGWSLSTHPANREQPEWPPHPDRVFMALVAAHFESTGSNEELHSEKVSLECLENMPMIFASDCQYRETVTYYVPVNDTTAPRQKKGQPFSDDQIKQGVGLLPDCRSRQPRYFPTAIPDNPIVYFCWMDLEPSIEIRSALSKLCAKVTYIGHSASLVHMWIEDNPPDACRKNGESMWRVLKPVEGKNTRYRLRITGKGRLDQLEKQYPGLRPTSSLWMGYDEQQIKDVISETEKSSCFNPNLLIFRRLEGSVLGLESTLQVVHAFHKTIIDLCPEPVPEWISGHKSDNTPSEEDHIAFIPLPHVGREHADGHLLGVAIAIPKIVDQEEISRCFKPILYDENGMVKPIFLKMGRLGVWKIELDERESRPVALKPEIWTSYRPVLPSRRWATVTPISLDRHTKETDKWRHMEESIKKSCERIELPRPIEVILSPVSMFIGSPHSRSFPRMERKSDGGEIFHSHAILIFPEPIRGPILLGAGRYRGYGLCRPLQEGWEIEE